MDRLYSSNFYGVPAAGAAPSGYGGYGVLGQGMVPQSLQQSPAYKQTDWRGRQRMEQMVAMGLPFNTDPSRIRAESALSLAMGRPIASTTMPQPWGTWGPLSAGDVSSTGKQQSSKQILASTPFGERVRNEAPAPTLAGSLTGFGGIPRFPYANY